MMPAAPAGTARLATGSRWLQPGSEGSRLAIDHPDRDQRHHTGVADARDAAGNPGQRRTSHRLTETGAVLAAASRRKDAVSAVASPADPAVRETATRPAVRHGFRGSPIAVGGSHPGARRGGRRPCVGDGRMVCSSRAWLQARDHRRQPARKADTGLRQQTQRRFKASRRGSAAGCPRQPQPAEVGRIWSGRSIFSRKRGIRDAGLQAASRARCGATAGRRSFSEDLRHRLPEPWWRAAWDFRGAA